MRIPRATDGTERIKGFGYAEFESVEALKDAVRASGDQLLNRPLRIDLAGTKDDEGRGGGCVSLPFNHPLASQSLFCSLLPIDLSGLTPPNTSWDTHLTS